MEYYSAIKNDKIMAFAGKWMKLENIMLSEKSQSQKSKGRMILLISGWWHIMGGREGGKNGGRRDCIEGKEGWEGWEGWGGGKNNRMNKTPLPYVNVWLHKWYASTSRTKWETRCIPFFYNKNEFKKNSHELVSSPHTHTSECDRIWKEGFYRPTDRVFLN